MASTESVAPPSDIHFGHAVTLFDKSQYFETGSGNKVARRSYLHGSQNIRVTKGKSIIQLGAGTTSCTHWLKQRHALDEHHMMRVVTD
jgi:hypothetical protein